MSTADSLPELAEAAGVKYLHVITWRDLEHPEAGGSELHVNRIAEQWARAGIEVTLRTSSVSGAPSQIVRDGYTVERRGSSLSVLSRNPISELLAKRQPGTGLVEVWHGINFMAPLWARIPRVAIAHHVHGRQFLQVLPGPIGRIAQQLERRVYPRVYQNTDIVTLSASSREELLELQYFPERVHVASPGVDPRFCPDPSVRLSPTPMMMTVARLMPQKHVDVTIRLLAQLQNEFRGLQLMIVGDGPERGALEALADDLGVRHLVNFAGRVNLEALISGYRRSWLVVSASSAEGWGMTLTEAGSCGTPAVATRIAGHVDAVIDGSTGLLGDTPQDLYHNIAKVLRDPALRSRLACGALEHCAQFTWTECARRTLHPLAQQMMRERSNG